MWQILVFIRSILGFFVLLLAGPFAFALKWCVGGNRAFPQFSRQGYYLLRKHFYSSIPDEYDLGNPLANEPSEVLGIDFNDEAALDFLTNVVAKYRAEFSSFPLEKPASGGGFYIVNGAYMAGDAEVYYAMIRHHRPRRIIEIGGGNSTLLAAAACLKNETEFGAKPRLTAVEPFPSRDFKKGFPGLDEILERRVQSVELSFFTSLEAGDILFIDSSHVLRPGGDVQFEYCQVLPRLAPGVLVHIHDISLPKPYHKLYYDNHWYWNEQYLLQAFLTFNPRFEVLWAGTDLYMKYPEKLSAAFHGFDAMRKSYPLAEPSAFWMRVKNAGDTQPT